jgi:hypothetical protein
MNRKNLAVSLSDMISKSATDFTNIINSCSFTQPHVESGKPRMSTSSVNCVAVRAGLEMV